MRNTGASVQGGAKGTGGTRLTGGICFCSSSGKAKAGWADFSMLFAGLRVLSIVKVSRSTCAAIPVLRGRGRQYSLVTDSTDFVEPRRTGLRAASGLVGSRGASFAYGVRTSSACFQLLPSRARGNGVDSTGFVGAVRGLKFSGSTGKAKVWLRCYGDQVPHSSRALVSH